jgi:hypothetical protein
MLPKTGRARNRDGERCEPSNLVQCQAAPPILISSSPRDPSTLSLYCLISCACLNFLRLCLHPIHHHRTHRSFSASSCPRRVTSERLPLLVRSRAISPTIDTFVAKSLSKSQLAVGRPSPPHGAVASHVSQRRLQSQGCLHISPLVEISISHPIQDAIFVIRRHRHLYNINVERVKGDGRRYAKVC